MKSLRINFNNKTSVQTIKLNSSKSESNRLLIIQALSDDKIEIENLSIANDTILLQKLIEKTPENNWNIEDAGTSMRFLTSYLALTKEGSSVTGTERMKKRPIKILVNALRELGSKISYLQEIDYFEEIIKHTFQDKKNVNQKIRTCVLNGIGDCEYDIEINPDLILDSLEYYNKIL